MRYINLDGSLSFPVITLYVNREPDKLGANVKLD